MNDIIVRVEGRAGRITLNRPHALNAMTYAMCLAIKEVLKCWVNCPDVDLILIDAIGERAFCAGGDVADMYHRAPNDRTVFGRKFWRDEYRMNAAISDYPKPIVSFLHGFVMGGGVGIGCHGSHRIVGESSQIAMPECAIGLVPDVGGSYLLAQGPGRTGEYLGITGQRMNATDAILIGFADIFIAQSDWPEIKGALCREGQLTAIEAATSPPPMASQITPQQDSIDQHFSQSTLVDVMNSLENKKSDFTNHCLKLMSRNSPLSMACTLALIGQQRRSQDLRQGLSLEYRFVSRALDSADFMEGIRSLIIDKDNQPNWSHAAPNEIEDIEIEALLAPLGTDELTWDDRPHY